MPAEEISELIGLYLKEKCSPAQKEQVEQWFENYRNTAHEFYENDMALIHSSTERSLLRLREMIKKEDDARNAVKKNKLWPVRIAAAAVLFIVLFGGLLFYFSKNGQEVSPNFYANDVPPGKNRATLTLSDGSSVILDDASKGKIATEAGITITKNKEGQLIYEVSQVQHPGTKLTYNTITTPRGGQYHVKLPDGTDVWLNTSSSLKFPVNFSNQKVRKVTLTGEGYFEVAKDLEMPFIVSSDQQDVKVHGTYFNINAYGDENAIITTLLEGKVSINGNIILKPGDQSINNGLAIRVQQVDPEIAIAWKNGKFKFANENIRVLMNKIARWYDVEVVYEGAMSHKNFSGSVSRFENVSKILDILQSTNTVHFKVEGRRITVMP